MTKLESWILQACKAFGLQADFDFVLDVDDAHRIRPIARIRNLGARNGMLIFRNYDDVRSYAEGLARAGYGYSTLDEPSANETFDLESFKEMFIEWGWSGSDADRPPELR